MQAPRPGEALAKKEGHGSRNHDPGVRLLEASYAAGMSSSTNSSTTWGSTRLWYLIWKYRQMSWITPDFRTSFLRSSQKRKIKKMMKPFWSFSKQRRALYLDIHHSPRNGCGKNPCPFSVPASHAVTGPSLPFFHERLLSMFFLC